MSALCREKDARPDTLASQLGSRRARNADGRLFYEPQDGQRADDGVQHSGLRVRMLVRLCRRQGQVSSLLPSFVEAWSSAAGTESCSKRTASMLSSALSTAVCQARAEETILENALLYSSAHIGAAEVANRSWKVRSGRYEDDWKRFMDPTVPSIHRSFDTHLAALTQIQTRR